MELQRLLHTAESISTWMGKAFAWLIVANGLVYLVYSLASGHVRRDLAPTAAELSPRHIGHEILEHARLRFPEGEAARRYNTLQKLAYCGTVFVLLPLMVLTGLTMSPGIDAAWPWLLDLFGGRQLTQRHGATKHQYRQRRQSRRPLP